MFVMLFLGHNFTHKRGEITRISVIQTVYSVNPALCRNGHNRKPLACGNTATEIGYIVIEKLKSFGNYQKLWLYAVNTESVDAYKAFFAGEIYCNTCGHKQKTSTDY